VSAPAKQHRVLITRADFVPGRISMADPYAILGLSPSAAPEVVRAAYLALVKKYHPDAGSGEPDKFREVQDAYELIIAGAARPQANVKASSNRPDPQSSTRASQPSQWNTKAGSKKPDRRLKISSLKESLTHWSKVALFTLLLALIVKAGVGWFTGEVESPFEMMQPRQSTP